MNSFLSKSLCLFFLLCVLATCPAIAQKNKVNYAGKDFWLTLQQSPTTWKYTFYISGAHDANIIFDYTTPGLTKNYFLKADTVLVIELTGAEANALGGQTVQQSQVVNNQSLHITADTDIVVQFLLIGGASDDGTLLYPSDKQNYGQDYILNGTKVAPIPTLGHDYGAYSIVSRCDSVVLEIIPSANAYTHPAGVPFTIVMKKGNSYIFDCSTPTNDLSGTKIHVKYASCPNPINIFINHQSTFVWWPTSATPTCCADQLIEQVLPVSVWDTIYPVVCFANNPYNLVKIVSASGNNKVFFDGVLIRTLSQNEGYDTIIKRAVVITASAPIGVTQHMVSQSQVFSPPNIPVIMPADSVSDPSTLWPLSMRDGLRDTYFKVGGATYSPKNRYAAIYTLNYVTLISKDSSIHDITLNNIPVDTQFVPFPQNAGYMYANIRLDTAANKIYHLVSKDRILAYYYGAYKEGSCAYAIGDAKNTPDPQVPNPPDSTDPDTPTHALNVWQKAVNVAIYPNPTTGIVNIASSTYVNVTVSSIDGRLLLWNNKTKKIDISTLPGGVYVIKITDENGLPLTVQKIIKLE